MDTPKRLILFFVISAAFLLLWNQIFPPPAPAPPERAGPEVVVAEPEPRLAPALAGPAEPERTVTVRSPLYEYRLSTRGGAFTAAELLRFESYVREGAPVQLIPRGVAGVLSHRVAVGGDTLDLRRLSFRASAERLVLEEGEGPQTLTFTSTGSGPVQAQITYTFHPDRYLVDMAGRITGFPAGATLLTELGTGLAPHDAPEHGSENELAVVGWNSESIERLLLRKIEGAAAIDGPLVWAGVRDRYFLLALLNQGEARFSGVVARDVPDERYAVAGEDRVSPRARAFTVQPLGADGAFRFQAYLGPQEHDRLAAVGHELEEVNPYGYRWLRPVVRPIAAVVLWVLEELHDNLGIAYGWVLIIFGVMMRVLLWPLNAKAMRAQMKNMAVQPVLQARMKEIQEKYKGEPQKQQQAMIAMYQELGVNPFSMLSGCLPLLLPWPILITLFFVFQSAIEFRGAEFWWLPDLSLRDPYYVLPVFLVASMFALQWISTKMSGMEQNPQMKMMMYTMPLAVGFLFFMLPSGLNLYYASTNVASLPQQLLISRERRRATEAQKAADAEKARASRSAGGARRARKRG